VIKQHTLFFIDNWGACFDDQTLHIFHNDRIDCRDVLCCSPFIVLCNGLKMGEYKAYWLTDYPLINSWACAKNNEIGHDNGDHSFF